MSEDVEDVWTVVRERDGLRARIKRLEAENAKLRAIIASSTEQVRLKSRDQPQPQITTQVQRRTRLHD